MSGQQTVSTGVERRDTIYVVAPMSPSAAVPFFGPFVPIISESLRRAGWPVDETTVTPAFGLGTLSKVRRHLSITVKILALHFKRPRILYVHSPAWFSLLLLPLLGPGTTCFVNIHGSEIHGRGRIANIFWRAARAFIRRADLVISPSRTFANTIAEATRVPEACIYASPSGGFLPERFFYDPALRSERPLIGYVSRVTEKKGWRLFLDVVERAAAENDDLHAVMLGDGPDHDLLLAEIERRKLQRRVSFVGAVPQDQLQAHYAAMHAFVFPSDISGVDTLGLVSLEAQACGTPVIATRSGITAEYVEEGVNGFLCERGDARAFADAVKACLGWTESRRREIAMSAAQFAAPSIGHALALKIGEIVNAKHAARNCTGE